MSVIIVETKHRLRVVVEIGLRVFDASRRFFCDNWRHLSLKFNILLCELDSFAFQIVSAAFHLVVIVVGGVCVVVVVGVIITVVVE